MSRKYEDCGALVQSAIALATGHRRLSMLEENAKAVRFCQNHEPLFAIEKLAKQLNVWCAERAHWSSRIAKIDRDAREVGTQKSGKQAKGRNPGFHSNMCSYLKSEEVACFHPSSLEEVWELLEELTA